MRRPTGSCWHGHRSAAHLDQPAAHGFGDPIGVLSRSRALEVLALEHVEQADSMPAGASAFSSSRRRAGTLSAELANPQRSSHQPC